MFYLIYQTSWGKEIKCETSRAFYHFCNELNKFNNTVARILDYMHYMSLKLLNIHIFGLKMSKFGHLLRNVIMDAITFPENL